MKRTLFSIAACIVCMAAHADGPITTPAQAFTAGKDFAKGSKGTAAASGFVNTTTGETNVPKYNTNPPEKSIYGGGKSLIGGAGDSKISTCSSYVAGSAYEQQECNAVNYLNNMHRTNGFTINKDTDPLMVNSKSTIKNPGTIPADGTSTCHIEKETIPGTFTTETCEESTVLVTYPCKKTLTAVCGFNGAPIKTHTESKTGAFVYSTLTPSGTPGLYNYNMEVPYRNCGGEGSAEVVFELDTVGMGGYITVNLSNLDDSAAVAVNTTTVFAGYPNAGPQYSDDGFFPKSRKDFQIGYSWSEDAGGEQCVEWDLDGNCTRKAWVPDVKTFYANTKLLDFCPAGYSPVTQKSFQWCDPDTGSCTPVDTYTPNNVSGFFCNTEGKFLMNKHEGAGTWAGSVAATMPLQLGSNSIKVYWGTGAWGDACGNVKVSGQIYNVAPGCTNGWDDQCKPARDALPTPK